MNTKKSIGELVLKTIIDKTKDDERLRDFILSILFEECKHTGPWWRFKEFYKSKIKEYTKEWT